ncbi:hypothetical protein ACLUXA_07935 [Limosilactobacillus mucosae]
MRKRKTAKYLRRKVSPNIVITVLAGVLVLNMLIAFSINTGRARSSAVSERQIYNSKVRKLKALNTEEAKPSHAKKFDLVAQEKQLTDQYSSLISQLYGNGIKNKQDFESQKANIKRLFGPGSFTQLENQALINQNGSFQALAAKNTKASVYFYGFNHDAKTIHIVSLAEYTINSNDGNTGTTYIDTIYSFSKKKAVSSEVTSAVHAAND